MTAVAAGRPFALDLGWSDSFGGAWNGFFVEQHRRHHAAAHGILGVQDRPEAERHQGLGSTPVNALSAGCCVYYTTFDPVTFATEPTLGISAAGTRRRRRRTPGDLLVK